VGPHPAVAAVRHAVRASLADLEPGAAVLVACSGGADSLALAAAVAFEAPKAGLLAGGITVDHGLQPGSAEQARRVSNILDTLGLSPVLSVAVTVARPEDASNYPGPEAAARTARYAALDLAAERAGSCLMLGHTLDDQAETVLLGLARGSGPRSLAGMAPVAGRYRRPLLGLRRSQTQAACAAQGLQTWDDPQNNDPAFTRVRVRRLMPVLEEALGPGVAEALARTAALLRADAEVLDAVAATEAGLLGGPEEAQVGGWPADTLAGLPMAIRLRLLRSAALAAGCPAGALSQRHIGSLDELVTGWHGQRWADLPGGIRCRRRYGRLLFSRTGGPGVAPRDDTAGGPGVAPRDNTAGGPGVDPLDTLGARSEDAGGRE
jgi:tRNA(Ile)-lysidine synthase